MEVIMDEERMLVTMEMEDGEEIEFEVYCIFEIEELGNEYAAMIRADKEEIEEYYLFRVKRTEVSEDGEDETYEVLNIEDEEEYDTVEEAFSGLLDSQEWNALYEEDDE